MIKKKSNSFLSCDRKTSVNVVMWCPDETEYDKPVAVLQICHGMIEYIDRYDGFARYMAERGFVVVGNDHLGHGKSVCTDDDLGFFKDKNPGEALAKDAHHLTVLIKKMYPGIPYYLAGHSMGSFVTRRYICDYGYELDGVIVMGTGHQPAPMVLAGKMLADAVRLIKGDRYRSRLISKIMFGTYNKRIKNVRTVNDWLTRDEAVVDEYNAGKLTTFLFTVNGYRELMNMILYVRKPRNIERIPKNLPMLMISGLDDPVGEYGKGVYRAYNSYHGHIDDIDLRLYEDCRHELCNELNKEEIYEEIHGWIMNHMSK